MVKKCNDCQKQISFEKKGDKYYSLDLNKKSIYLCPSCWEVKKNNYKELLKEDVLKETIIQYKRYGYIDWQELDKNDEQIVSQVLVHKQELGQEKTDAPNSWEISHSISFTVCWGCDKWMEEKNEDHSNCQEIIAEKSECFNYYK